MSSYKFRVLIDTKGDEDIFRDIVISASADFELLYHTILTSFDFSSNQLGSFYLSNESWDRGREIALMDMGLENNPDAPLVMGNNTLSDLLSKKGDKLILVYDFLKMWCFLVELVDILPENELEPKIILSVGDAPAEDSKEIDFNDLGDSSSLDLGNDFDDIFSDYDEDDFEDFENIDDLDI